MQIRDILGRRWGISMTDLFGIVSYVCGLTREEIFLHIEGDIEEEKMTQIEKLVDQRRTGKPLAYITGRREFYSRDFFVDETTLVPRPETEILVDEALELLTTTGEGLVLDMGTGSGAIGLTVADRSSRRVICVDISQGALGIARKNAYRMGLSHMVDFVCSDLFSAFKEEGRFGMILANLPYIEDDEWAFLMKDVKDFEPRGALWGGKNGIEIYEPFIRSVPRYLMKEGHLLCEIGGARQADLMAKILRSLGFKTRTRKDYGGEERVIIGSWTNLS